MRRRWIQAVHVEQQRLRDGCLAIAGQGAIGHAIYCYRKRTTRGRLKTVDEQRVGFNLKCRAGRRKGRLVERIAVGASPGRGASWIDLCYRKVDIVDRGGGIVKGEIRASGSPAEVVVS
jgi:hypothetical protein